MDLIYFANEDEAKDNISNQKHVMIVIRLITEQNFIWSLMI